MSFATNETEVDIVVVGGGSAGSTAAIRAQQALPRGRVILLEKAHIKRSGAIAIGMDGLNNAIIPGHATPEQYVKEITMANDGIVNQRAVWEYATPQLRDDPGARRLGREVPEDRDPATSTSRRCTTRAATCCRCPRATISRRS